MAAPAVKMINTRKMRYTGDAMSALKGSDLKNNLHSHDHCKDSIFHENGGDNGPSSKRVWLDRQYETRPPLEADGTFRHIGSYPLTSNLAPWLSKALASYKPEDKVLELVKPYAAAFHNFVESERKSSTGLHDLDAIELTYQYTLEIGAAILLAADATDKPVDLQAEFHTSRAGGDNHFSSWGKVLTGLECDPPIIVQFPFYLMMCQSFTFEPNSAREDYVYSALTGVDWAKGNNKFNDRIRAFESLAKASLPTLDDKKSGQDRCFWRVALAYLRAMNDCENARSFKIPKVAAIKHGLDDELVIAARALDTIGSAYMCSDGAAWLDNEGMDSLIGSALPNDVMDLHTDIRTGETRNLLRLLYPEGLTIEQSMKTVSTLLSGMLCEIFRGHHRARFNNREDGRIAATSPPYSFCRARHRKIFETLEMYITHYPKFWEWTWEIFRMAKEQVTEEGLLEPLVCGLKRARTQEPLPPSPATKFYNLYYDMVENGAAQVEKRQPLGVTDDLAPVIRKIHSLWHKEILEDNKKPGWGIEYDAESDGLFSEAGTILSNRSAISDDMYKFAIAYGRLSMGLPYVAYHTVDAIIMAYGAL